MTGTGLPSQGPEHPSVGPEHGDEELRLRGRAMKTSRTERRSHIPPATPPPSKYTPPPPTVYLNHVRESSDYAVEGVEDILKNRRS